MSHFFISKRRSCVGSFRPGVTPPPGCSSLGGRRVAPVTCLHSPSIRDECGSTPSDVAPPGISRTGWSPGHYRSDLVRWSGSIEAPTELKQPGPIGARREPCVARVHCVHPMETYGETRFYGKRNRPHLVLDRLNSQAYLLRSSTHTHPVLQPGCHCVLCLCHLRPGHPTTQRPLKKRTTGGLDLIRPMLGRNQDAQCQAKRTSKTPAAAANSRSPHSLDTTTPEHDPPLTPRGVFFAGSLTRPPAGRSTRLAASCRSRRCNRRSSRWLCPRRPCAPYAPSPTGGGNRCPEVGSRSPEGDWVA